MLTVATSAPPDDRVAERVVHAVWGGLLAVLTGGPILYALAARRPFHSAASPLFGAVSPGFTDSIRQLVALLVVGTAVAIVILALPVARTPGRGGLAVAGAVAFGGAGILSGLVNGAALGIGQLALPATALAMGLFPPPSREWFERRFTLALRVLVWGSLAAALAAPGWAVQQGYDSGVIGIGTRLAGLTPHPNALGPIAVVLVVLEWRRRPRAALPVLLALGALGWTQSKTSWAALGVLAAVVLFRRLRRRSPEKTLLPVVVLAAVVGASAWFGLGLAADGQDTVRQDESAETFTGRTAIWEVTLEVWRAEPLLGYGPDLWGDTMDRRYRHRVGFPPGHAHNQLIHTLGESGVLGAGALVVLLTALGGLARRADPDTAGVAGALFLVLVVQSFSEAPLQSIPNGTNFLLLFGTFGYLLLGAGEATDAERSIAVLVATFRRPGRLVTLLDALDAVVAAPPAGCRVRVVVCDNDPDASARDVCAGRVVYVHEPAPGIAAARNALVEAAAGDDLIAFIDDDEWPAAGWLDALVDASDRFAADVVTGAVVSEFDGPVAPSLARSFDRPRQETGTAVAWPRTGNVLIRRRSLEHPPLRFRDSYGLSGGSDSMLFLELSRRGATMVWSDEAVVHEAVPASRTTLKWVVRRAFRLGNTHTRFDRDLDGRPRTMATRVLKAIGWIGTGVLAGLAAAARRDGAGVVGGLERVARGAGMLAAFGGFRFVEYARPAT